MKNKFATIIAFLLFVSFYVELAKAQNVVFTMTNVEKTGEKRRGVAPRSSGEDPVPWYYEIEIEWYQYASYTCTTQLYRNNNILLYSQSPYHVDAEWSFLYGQMMYASYYRYYDWVPEGTWYYKAYNGSVYTNEECESVP